MAASRNVRTFAVSRNMPTTFSSPRQNRTALPNAVAAFVGAAMRQRRTPASTARQTISPVNAPMNTSGIRLSALLWR